LTREYFNHSAGIWDETSTETDRNKLGLMAQQLNIMPGDKVLDVGTGTGVFLPFLFARSGHVVALDFAEEMLRRARAKGFNGRVDYLHADVTNLPLRDNLFDVTVCYSSFPHFQDKPAALAEIKRVTRCGGRLFICHTSSRAEINQVHSHVSTLARDLIPDGDEMQAMLALAGFIGVEIEDGNESYLARASKPE